MAEKIKGFEPFCRNGAKLLILGSFPSVKSRETEFYYGNPRNRFWAVLSEFFGESAPVSVDDKKNFLSKHKIALWDIVAECEIKGSMDSSIKSYKVADVEKLLQKNSFGLIILNGNKAGKIFLKKYSGISVPYIKLPSTSPANFKFEKDKWFDGLRIAFGI